MRKIGVFCVIVIAMFGSCILSSYAGDKPGDKLTEVFKKDVKPTVSLIPAGVKIAKDFKPGKGEAIGTVRAIKGTVLTIHRDEKTAYILKKGNKLYTSDTLISEEQSKAQAELKDGSFITLGPYTKMVFDKSIYDPSKPTRNSLLNLLFGKARFIVTKLANFRNSRFNVKTPTAVAGVRGSDFAICVAPGSPLTTTLMTGESTTVTSGWFNNVLVEFFYNTPEPLIRKQNLKLNRLYLSRVIQNRKNSNGKVISFCRISPCEERIRNQCSEVIAVDFLQHVIHDRLN